MLCMWLREKAIQKVFIFKSQYKKEIFCPCKPFERDHFCSLRIVLQWFTVSYLKLVYSFIPYLCIGIGTLCNLVQIFWLQTKLLIMNFAPEQLSAEGRKTWLSIVHVYSVVTVCATLKLVVQKYIKTVFTQLSHFSRHVSVFKTCISKAVVQLVVDGRYNLL